MKKDYKTPETEFMDIESRIMEGSIQTDFGGSSNETPNLDGTNYGW